MFLAGFGSKAFVRNGEIEILPKYEGLKMPSIRLLIYMISALFVPNLAPLLLLARLYQKVARIRLAKCFCHQ